MKTAVVKLSGKNIKEFLSGKLWKESLQKLKDIYDGVIIVHGAGNQITEWGSKLGLQAEFIEGQRITSKDYMEVVAAVQGGLINSQLTAKINSWGFTASGFSGIDMKTFSVKKFNKKLGFVGTPLQTGSIDWLKELVSKNIIPVFSSICSDDDGNLVNVNADIFTEIISVSIEADTVFFISDVNGVLVDGKIKNTINEDEINIGIAEGEITNGMIPKLKSAASLLQKGVGKVWIGSDLNNSILKKEINGTWIINIESGSSEFLSVA
jgi:acetylglutamate kinase